MPLLAPSEPSVEPTPDDPREILAKLKAAVDQAQMLIARLEQALADS